LKIIAVILMVLGLVTIFVPSFYTCQAKGKVVELPGGGSIPMTCWWTARAEILPGVLLALVGGMLFISGQLESRRFLSILALILGIFILLLPMKLIGICANPTMPCVLLMKPVLLLIGVVVVALGVGAAICNFINVSEKI
jgi:drug/metabolite transporter (DMT)-like permease